MVMLLIKIPDYRNSIIVARNSGQAKRATAIAERLGLSIGVIHGADDKDAQTDSENSTQPPPTSLKRNSIQALFFSSVSDSKGESFIVDLVPTIESRKSVFELPSLSMPNRIMPREKLPLDVVGDVSGRIAIIVVS